MIVIRAAALADAEPALDVVRRSIRDLCVADHKHDAPTLAKWLENKTLANFNIWLANEKNFCAVAVQADRIVGVAIVNRSGEISLFYLAPDVQRRGIGTQLHAALERAAKAWGLQKLHLESTLAARSFYESLGYVSTGSGKVRFGVLLSYPYEKMLRSGSAPP